MSDRPFAPLVNKSIALVCSTSSAHVAFTEGAHWIRVVNPTTSVVHVRTADAGSLGANAADFPIAPGATGILKINPTHNRLAAILVSGTGTIHATPGEPLK